MGEQSALPFSLTHLTRKPRPAPRAGWQSGHAAACKAVYAGSIPTSASIASFGYEVPYFINVDADFSHLKQRLRTIEDLHDAEKVLVWDQATYMPPGGAEARGRQLGLLSTLAHERRIDPAISRLPDSATPRAD